MPTSSAGDAPNSGSQDQTGPIYAAVFITLPARFSVDFREKLLSGPNIVEAVDVFGDTDLIAVVKEETFDRLGAFILEIASQDVTLKDRSLNLVRGTPHSVNSYILDNLTWGGEAETLLKPHSGRGMGAYVLVITGTVEESHVLQQRLSHEISRELVFSAVVRGRSRVLARVQVPDNRRLSQLVTEQVYGFPGIRATRTYVLATTDEGDTDAPGPIGRGKPLKDMILLALRRIETENPEASLQGVPFSMLRDTVLEHRGGNPRSIYVALAELKKHSWVHVTTAGENDGAPRILQVRLTPLGRKRIDAKFPEWAPKQIEAKGSPASSGMGEAMARRESLKSEFDNAILDAGWFLSHQQQIEASYAGRFVAIRGRQIVAVAESPETIIDTLRNLGLDPRFTFVEYVPRPEESIEM